MSKFNFGAVAQTINEETTKQVEKKAEDTSITDKAIKEINNEIDKKEKKENKVIGKNIDKVVKNAIDKILQIEEDLKGFFIERDNEIRIISLALVSATNAFFHGPAGTGKSSLVEEYNKRITNSSYFRVLMGKTTEPGEVFGPTSIEAMKQDKYKFNTAGKLPEANVAFLDECFKANSAVLNSLLTIMNEKYFFNDGVQKVPLISLFGASNEYAEENSLEALYDRFLLRWHVNYVQDNKNRIKLFNNFLIARSGSSKYNKAALTLSPTAFIDIDEIKVLNEKAKEVTFTNKVLTMYNKILMALEKQGITISDRRKNESLKVLQANALLNNRNAVEIDDFESLVYTLWTGDERQLQIVSDEIIKFANPIREKYNNLKASFEKYKAEFNNLDKDADDYAFQKTMLATDTVKNINYALSTIDGIKETLKNEGKVNTADYTDFCALADSMNEYLGEIKKEILPLG